MKIIQIKKFFIHRKMSFFTLTIYLLSFTYSALYSQWVRQSPYPTGRHLYSVYFHNPKHGFIAGINHHLLETTDGGHSWIQRMTDDFGTDPFNRIAFGDSMVGLIVGNCSISQTDIFRTNDGGKTWLRVNDFSFAGSWRHIDFITPQRVFIGANGACAYSSNGGQTWVLKSGYPNCPNIFCMDFWDEQIGIVGGELSQSSTGIYKTTDGGITWQYKFSRSANDIMWWDSVTVLASIGSDIYRSTDAGETWHILGSGITTGLFEIERLNENTLTGVSGLGDVWRSTDGGINWMQVFDGPGDLPSTWSIHFMDSLHGWIVGQYGFIYASTDGGLTWRQMNNGVGVQLYELEFLTDNFGMGAGINGYVFRTTNSGDRWEVHKVQVTGQIFGRTESLRGISIVDTSFAVVAGPGGTVFKTDDGGITWQSIGYPNLSDNFWIEDVDFVNRNVGWIVGLDNGPGRNKTVYKTTDGGSSWTLSMSQNSYMWAVDFIDENYGWIATIGPLFFRTTDGGNTWTQGILPSGDITTIVSDIKFANHKVGWVVGWYGYVARTTDGGISWTLQELPDPNEDPDILFSIHVVNPFEAWASGRESDVIREGVVYHTTNGGVTWTREVVTEDPYWGYTITGSPSGHIWIGGYEGRIMKKESLTKIENDSNQSRFEKFQLLQNYPNPFNQTTKIKFILPDDELTTLRIYNILGQEIITLIHQKLKSGEYIVEWNASILPSGVYLYQLKAGEFLITKRMTLIK